MTFDEWLGETENYSLRIERLYEELDYIAGTKSTDDKSFRNKVKMLSWLKAAYDVGYEQGKSE